MAESVPGDRSPSGPVGAIRPAVVADAAGIAAVQVETWRTAYRGLIPDDYLEALDVDGRTGVWRQILRSSTWPQRGALVLDRDDLVIGFLHVAPGRDDDLSPATGEVTALYLLQQHWRRGGGRRLMAAGTDTLRSGGFTEAILWVLATNERGRAFYEADGWTPDGAERQEVRGGVVLDEVRYRRLL